MKRICQTNQKKLLKRLRAIRPTKEQEARIKEKAYAYITKQSI
jgi:hypothetical protein